MPTNGRLCGSPTADLSEKTQRQSDLAGSVLIVVPPLLSEPFKVAPPVRRSGPTKTAQIGDQSLVVLAVLAVSLLALESDPLEPGAPGILDDGARGAGLLESTR